MDPKGDALIILCQLRQSRVEADAGLRMSFQIAQSDFGKAVLTQMNVVGVGRTAVKNIQTEIDALTALVHQVGVILLGKSHAFDLRADTKSFQTLDHAPVIDGRARRVDDARAQLR